jgi:hypothetical protein
MRSWVDSVHLVELVEFRVDFGLGLATDLGAITASVQISRWLHQLLSTSLGLLDLRSSKQEYYHSTGQTARNLRRSKSTAF